MVQCNQGLADLHFQEKGTTQQCCVGKNWVIRFPPFPESVPEKHLFLDCNADSSVSNKTQLKVFKGVNTVSHISLAQLRDNKGPHMYSHANRNKYILFILIKHWKYTFFILRTLTQEYHRHLYLHCFWNIHSKITTDQNILTKGTDFHC